MHKVFKNMVQGCSTPLSLWFNNSTGFLSDFALCTQFSSLLKSIFMGLLLITLLKKYNPSRNLRSSSKINLYYFSLYCIVWSKIFFIMLHKNFGALCPCTSKTQRLLNKSNSLWRQIYLQLHFVIIDYQLCLSPWLCFYFAVKFYLVSEFVWFLCNALRDFGVKRW